jgi:hypothetical protein
MKFHLVSAALIVAFIFLGCTGDPGVSKRIASLESMVDEENERQNDRIKTIDTYMARIGEGALGPMEKQELIIRIAVLESRVNDLERRGKTPIRNNKDEDIQEKEKGRRASIRIKVLSGDRDPTSAKRMAMTLKRFGYEIEKTDIATKGKFRKTKIFYKSGHRDDAEEMAEILDDGADVKPLTWQSIFDIILVTGRP